eukprot:7391012-Prymnesium_polylepis.1
MASSSGSTLSSRSRFIGRLLEACTASSRISIAGTMPMRRTWMDQICRHASRSNSSSWTALMSLPHSSSRAIHSPIVSAALAIAGEAVLNYADSKYATVPLRARGSGFQTTGYLLVACLGYVSNSPLSRRVTDDTRARDAAAQDAFDELSRKSDAALADEVRARGL